MLPVEALLSAEKLIDGLIVTERKLIRKMLGGIKWARALMGLSGTCSGMTDDLCAATLHSTGATDIENSKRRKLR